jgi:DNA-directed RNA polymerase subunit A'
MLMMVEDQIISPRHGHAIIKPTEDHITGMYIFTKNGTTFSKGEAVNLMATCGIYELPKPDVKGGRYSGKLLFSQLLPSDFNYTARTKLCRCGERCKREDCPTEGYVVIKDGKLLNGALESKTYSSEIVERFVPYGSERVRKFIDNSTRLASYAITTRGFSISLDNYTVSKEVGVKLSDMSEKAEREVNTFVMQYENKTLERLPGRTLRETLEEKIMVLLGRLRDATGNMLESEFTLKNNAILLANIGARGNILNTIHMAGIISQQAVRDKRLHRGYERRVLSHFKPRDIGARARGYISANFMKGLTPAEFFFQAMGGREALVNTAMRTARSGYMQRRFINALQDLVISSDLSVRDASGRIVEYLYGGDGADTTRVERPGEVALPERE